MLIAWVCQKSIFPEGQKRKWWRQDGGKCWGEGLLSMGAGEMGEYREKGESPSRKWPPDENKGIYFILFCSSLSYPIVCQVTLIHSICLLAKLVCQFSFLPRALLGQLWPDHKMRSGLTSASFHKLLTSQPREGAVRSLS